jgi:hypothetical protein
MSATMDRVPDAVMTHSLMSFLAPEDLALFRRTSRRLHVCAEGALKTLTVCKHMSLDTTRNILKSYPHLTELNLRGCESAGPGVFDCLAKMPDLNIARLKRVSLPPYPSDVWGSREVVQGVKAFILRLNWRELRQLDTTKTPFKVSGENLPELTLAFQRADHLEELKLNAEDDVRADYIRSQPPSLQMLFVDRVETQQECEAVVEKLEQPHLFTRVDMKLHLRVDEENKLRFLSVVVPQISLVEEIALRMNGLHPNELAPFCEALRQNKAITRFSLECYLADGQSVPILDGLLACPALKEVRISSPHTIVRYPETYQILDRYLRFPEQVAVQINAIERSFSSREEELGTVRRMYQNRSGAAAVDHPDDYFAVFKHMPKEEIVADYLPKLRERGISDEEIERMQQSAPNGLELIRAFDRRLQE